MSRRREPKSFQPQKVRPVAAALYDYLSDGQTHPMEDTLVAVTAAVPADAAYKVPAKNGDDADATARGARAAARNAIHVANCDGRIVVDRVAKTVTATASTIAAWTAFRAATPTAPVTETPVVVEPTAGTAPVAMVEDTDAMVAIMDSETIEDVPVMVEDDTIAPVEIEDAADVEDPFAAYTF